MDSMVQKLNDKRITLQNGLETAKKARDEADGKMQSRYDTQKEEAALDVAMHEALLADVDRLIQTLQDVRPTTPGSTVEVGRLVTIEFPDGEFGAYLFLDEQGGVDLGDVQTLSVASPVGKAVLGASAGEERTVRLATGDMVVCIVSVS